MGSLINFDSLRLAILTHLAYTFEIFFPVDLIGECLSHGQTVRAHVFVSKQRLKFKELLENTQDVFVLSILDSHDMYVNVSTQGNQVSNPPRSGLTGG
jgi:hypothetical protein